MKRFPELRKAAGLGERLDFARETGFSLRSLSAFDNDRREPPLFLIKYLRLLAAGCQFCPLLHRSNIPTHLEGATNASQQNDHQSR